MSLPPQFAQFDKRLLRRSFERAATSYDAAAVLQHEVCKRMDERLMLIKHQPATLLDAGSGTGNALSGLGARYPRARVITLDLALAMLQRARERTAWWKSLFKSPAAAVCGDIEQLPLANGSIDMVWSNLALQWMNDPDQAFAEFHRVLAPGGLLMFSTFGPDTLKELRAAYAGVDKHTHVSRFIDLHDVGDILVKRGFADPVMDMEPFTLTYGNVHALMRDLKAIGAHNVTLDRPPGLTGRARLAAVTKAYEPLRRDGRLPATFEVVYGHAWKPLPRVTASGKRVIDIKSIARALNVTPQASPITPRGIFVTGTDTGVGKTLVACALLHAFAARHLRVIGMKPVAAGADEKAGVLVNDDVEQLIAASNVAAPRDAVNPYCFAPPIAPHLAAGHCKIKINTLLHRYQQLSMLADVVVIEGAGGFCVPFNDIETSADFVQQLALPVVLVVGLRLGCLNHALLTAEAIRARGLVVAGWVANHIDPSMPQADANVEALQARLAAPLLARIAFVDAPDTAVIASQIELGVLL